nr:MAG TPA: helix-turn-helix domain protein [Caudoviricetes sp.]
MSDLYSNIHALCENEGIKDGTLCGNIGIRRSFLSELKAGRTKSLSAEVLSKIAAYFNVSVDYLLTGEQKENQPQQPQSEVDVTVERIRRKLESMPTEQREALMNLIEKM